MTIFNLHAAVLADYRDFVRSFFMIAEPRTREFVDRSLVEEGRLWPDFLLQVSPSYARWATVDELAAQGQLRQETASIFRAPPRPNEPQSSPGQPFHLYQHQVESLQQADAGHSFVVTTGTGSGKSLTYFLPIVESLLAQPATGDRVAALSATMVANRNATPLERRATVADFAQRLFGHPFTADQIIEETLVTFTEPGQPSQAELTAALTAPAPATLEDFRTHALARWVETEFGVEPEEGGRLKRRVPRTLAVAAARLAEASGVGPDICEQRLRDILNRGSELPRDDGGRPHSNRSGAARIRT